MSIQEGTAADPRSLPGEAPGGPSAGLSCRPGYAGPERLAVAGQECAVLDNRWDHAYIGLRSWGRSEAGYHASLSSWRPRVQVPSLPLTVNIGL